jgi:hypothetical protein
MNDRPQRHNEAGRLRGFFGLVPLLGTPNLLRSPHRLVQIIVAATVAIVGSASAAKVTADGFQVKVNGKNFVVKGVTYSPVPIGVRPGDAPPYGDYFTINYRNVWEPDIGLMRAAGINCIRLYAGNPGANAGAPGSGGNWKPFLDKLWNDGTDPIYVVMTSYVQGGDIAAGGAQFTTYLTEWEKLVKSTVTHPAVFGYLVGNEIFDGVGDAFWLHFGQLIDRAQAAGLSQGQNPFLLTAITDGQANQTWPPIVNGEKSGRLANLDAWAINVYRGAFLGGPGANLIFPQYKKTMANLNVRKPMLLGEFGSPHSTRAAANYGKPGGSAIDLDTISPSQMGPGKPFFDAQPVGDFLTKQWKTVKANLSAGNDQVCVGGFFFGFVDEWWKGGNANSHVGGPNQDFHGDAFAGSYADEGWYGLTEAVTASLYGAGKPNIQRKLTSGYRALKQFFSASSKFASGLYEANPPPRDKPSIGVRGPAVLHTSSARGNLRGNVQGLDEIVEVSVKRGGGSFRPAAGTSPWRFNAKFRVGRNRFIIRAKDADGDVTRKSVVVIRS